MSLRAGAIKPWQTESYKECQTDLVKFARKRGIPLDTPWRDLSDADRAWVIEGEGEWTRNVWYGVKRFFAWLETKAYKMHIRVLLSRYRSYTECAACGGSRLKPEALLWRLGTPSLNLRELMLMSLDDCRGFFAALELPAPLDEAADLAAAMRSVAPASAILADVGLGYLNLDRQSRTLSGGEVQRINLTTALGTSLVNTLFVLDEPSIGLHPRDVGRILGVMHRLRDAGNTLVVVEHDPKVMQAADRVLDIGPGPGEHGGEVVFFGPLAELPEVEGSLTADYLLPSPPGRDPAGALGSAARGRRAHRPGCRRAQLEGHRRRHPAAAPGVRDGRLGLGQVDAGPGRAALPRAAASQGQADGESRAPSRARRSRLDRRRRHGGSEPHRPHHPVESRELRGRLRRDSGSVCPAAEGPGAQVHRRNLQLQRGQRPLPHLRRQRLRARRVAMPLRRVSALSRLRRPRRYRAEVLEIRLTRGTGTAKSIADVLDLTVSEALEFFAGDSEVYARGSSRWPRSGSII